MRELYHIWVAFSSSFLHTCRHVSKCELLRMFAAHIYSMGLIFGFCACLLRIITAWASFSASAHHLLHIIQHGPHFRLLRIICCTYLQQGPHFRFLRMFAAYNYSMGLVLGFYACLLRIITAWASF
jgi:hypothetical protein